MRFAIYIPGDGRANAQKLDDVGLGHMRPNAAGIAAHKGPDGKPGVVFSWPTNDPRSVIAYLGDHAQTWVPAIESGDLPAARYWVGFTNDSPPTPDDLAYGSIPGFNVRLADGRDWVMPSAANFVRDISIGDDWFPEFTLQASFETLFQESMHWAEWLGQVDLDTGTARISGDVYGYLLRMLSLNYLLLPEVVEQLKLFNPEIIIKALMAATMGLPCVEATEG